MGIWAVGSWWGQMNNDAKDVVGRLRATNLLLVLSQIERFVFPLDTVLSSILVEHRSRFQQMINVVADIAHFGDMKHELLSSTEDILDPDSTDYYTQEYLDMLLSLYQGKTDLVHFDYDSVPSRNAMLAETCRSNLYALFQSIMWLRIAFYSCYPDIDLTPLNEGWEAFCTVASEIGQQPFGFDRHSLFISSIRSWRDSSLVLAALAKVEKADMPHKVAFFKAIHEVDDILAAS